MKDTLKDGDIAPDFTALDQNDTKHSLKDYQGKWVLLYFYPKDFTPGCTKEACSFRDNFSKLKEKLTILGVSGDSVKSHKNFSEKYHLPFPILADPSKEIIKAYGADGILFPKRVSFLINPEGKIAKVYPKVNPQTHTEEIINGLAALQ